jgi:hypothetical protein
MIAILAKSYIKPHVKILKKYKCRLSAGKTGKDLLWIKKKDLFICVTYNPHISSKYTRELNVAFN